MLVVDPYIIPTVITHNLVMFGETVFKCCVVICFQNNLFLHKEEIHSQEWEAACCGSMFSQSTYQFLSETNIEIQLLALGPKQ